MIIKEIQEQERPRERLFKYGVDNLSNEELIAIIIKCGTKNISSKEIANLILSKYDGINNLRSATINKLTEIKGVGKVKASQIICALELGKRVYYSYNDARIKISNTKDVYEKYKNKFNFIKYEKFCALYLDAKKNVIEFKTIFKGTLDRAVVHPREIFKDALLLSASSVICMHNHPSGDVNPSTEDIDITNSLINSGNMIGIKVIDHIIFGNNGYYSFYDNMQEQNKKK